MTLFPPRRRRLLIINGDPTRTNSLLQMARQMTLEPIIARSAGEGFKKASELKPDMIMLDLMLPNMGGFAILQQLKEDIELARIPIVVLTDAGEMASGSRVIQLALPESLC